MANSAAKSNETVKTVVVYRTTSNAGTTTGILGCVFAILGIFTIGVLFLPFAVLFSAISLLGSIFRLNALGLLMAITSSILTIVGFSLSPAAWLAVAALIASRH